MLRLSGGISQRFLAQRNFPLNTGPVRGMATLKEIQGRLKSIKNISKITKSMKMIASTKLIRAQRSMETARAYGLTSNAVFKYLDSNSAESSGKSVIVACSSDRGLCGAIHSSISKPVKIKCRDDPENTVVVAIGDKSRAQIARTARNQIVRSFNGVSSIPTFAEASKIASLVMNSDFEIGNIGIYYNKFQSVIAYEMTIIPAYTANNISSSEQLAQFELEDDDIIQNFAEFSMANSVYHALVEGSASEIAARRSAMENATKNAGEMIDKLTMIYNRSRQATITNELVDIITGASAL